MISSMKPLDELTINPTKWYMTTPQRRAVWHNEISMFIVLAMPLIVATFWYGATIQMYGFNGQVVVPASTGRGVGLTIVITIFLIVVGAIRLFIQPADERIANAQPVRGARRLTYAAFDGFLVSLITYQTLSATQGADVATWATSIGLGLVVTVVAYVSMHSMVEIPPSDRSPLEVWRSQIASR